jgi:arylsulfatase A-like enzyme
MIESVDQSVGRVMKRLDTLGLTEQTVIIFTSDNGGHGRITSHLPLRGNKGSFYEGGIRVPLIVKWPGIVKPGTECRVPVTSPDFYPTLLAMTRLQKRPQQHVDGVSLVPLLKQEAPHKPRSLYWHYPNYIGANHPGGARPCSVIRKGNWKLIESLEENRPELYNLKDDLGEKENLATRMPNKTRELRRMLERWRNEAEVQMPERNPDFDPK